MILATHQPIFLPWPGFFAKALAADCLVLLDNVQFPQGHGWVNRNRLKCDVGELWLTVPVWKKGRGKQQIGNVEICEEEDWRKKHLRSFIHYYQNAPYFPESFSELEKIYATGSSYLLDLNLALIYFLAEKLGLQTRIIRQSETSVTGHGTDLIIALCRHFQAEAFLNFPVVQKYLDLDQMQRAGIQLKPLRFQPPVYPQLWGSFIYNLSALDLWFNCGLKSQEIVLRAIA